MDHRFVRDLMMGVDGEAPACHCQPPTSAPSPHRATVVVAQSEDVGCAGAMCTEGWCKCARGHAGSRVVVRWERTAQKSESPLMPLKPDANIRQQMAP